MFLTYETYIGTESISQTVQVVRRGDFHHMTRLVMQVRRPFPERQKHATHEQVPGPCSNCDHQEVVRDENSLPKVEIVLHIHKRVGIFRVSRRTEITSMSRPAACRTAATKTIGKHNYPRIGQ